MFLYILLVLCGLSLAVNAYMIDLKNPLIGDSLVAIISIVSALCAIVLILIFLKAKQLKAKIDKP